MRHVDYHLHPRHGRCEQPPENDISGTTEHWQRTLADLPSNTQQNTRRIPKRRYRRSRILNIALTHERPVAVRLSAQYWTYSHRSAIPPSIMPQNYGPPYTDSCTARNPTLLRACQIAVGRAGVLVSRSALSQDLQLTLLHHCFSLAIEQNGGS